MYQSVYEGDVRFEHCYRVDEERHVPITDKLHCWRDWTRRYQYGQSRDRIAYALARERTLAQALAAGQSAAPRGATGIPPCPLPQPTNAFVPPPQTMRPASATAAANATEELRASREVTESDAGSNEERPPSAALEANATLVDAPGASCAGACGKAWSSCKQQCKGGNCRSGCDQQYRGCMKGCF